MIKSELIERITAQHSHLFHRDVEKVVNSIFDEIVQALRRGEQVKLRDFGVFSAKLREARQGRNPKTGVAVQVAKRAIPHFKTGKQMRARLNRESRPAAELTPVGGANK